MKQLLEKFGCTVIALNNEPNGKFAHTPEPIPENLTQLCDAVKEHKVKRGFLLWFYSCIVLSSSTASHTQSCPFSPSIFGC